jgi:hypothetical protein
VGDVRINHSLGINAFGRAREIHSTTQSRACASK